MSGSECARPLAEAEAAAQHGIGARHPATNRRRGQARQLEPEARIARDARLAGWVEAHEEELERHLLRMSLRAEDARDVLQEVWVTALRSPPDDGPDSNTRAWLYRVATRRALDVLARDRRHRELLAERSGRVTPEPEASPDAWVGRGSADRPRRPAPTSTRASSDCGASCAKSGARRDRHEHGRLHVHGR
jgi:hypothetical protein